MFQGKKKVVYPVNFTENLAFTRSQEKNTPFNFSSTIDYSEGQHPRLHLLAFLEVFPAGLGL